MYRELSVSHGPEHEATGASTSTDLNADGSAATRAPRKTLGQAVWQIVIADVSMSLDNVLAVAGAAQKHQTALIFGLALSVVLMGVAASLIAGLLHRHRWIAWVGLVIILYVAVRMLYEGADQLFGHTLPAIPLIKEAAAAAVAHQGA
jgi:YjbE family integral membrane protein